MNRKGMTLIELLVALVVSGILVAGVYRTFLSQQNTFSVQEQVVDMQQNVRLAVNRMTRELRMAGFGRPEDIFSHGHQMHGIAGWNTTVIPGGGGSSVTVVGAYQLVSTLKADASGTNTVVINASSFDISKKQYISINGLESHRITKITGDAVAGFTLELAENLTLDHFAGEPVYLVVAITYSLGMSDGKLCLLRDENLGLLAQPVAENIESLQFRYFDANGVETGTPDDIRMIQVTIVARSDRTDPELAKVGDGFRRRTLTTSIQLRNLSFS